jgi:Cu-processing system permease protein
MNLMFVLARQTIQGYVRDRLLHAVLVFAALLLAFSLFLSTLTFIEPRKILLDFGLASVSLIGVGFALLMGSTLVRREIDQRTIYTILAKPVRRSQYLFGKFLGGAAVLLVVHAICGGVLAGVIKALGDEVPSSFWPAVYLSTLEAFVVFGTALLLSLWGSSLLLSAALSLALFLLGRSNYSFLVMSQKVESSATKTLLRVLHDVLPSLQRFDVRELAAYGKPIPAGFVGQGTLYCAAYLIVLLALSVLLLRRKDLP